MNASLICLVSVLTAPPAESAAPTVDSASTSVETVIRGQSPDSYYQSPPAGGPGTTWSAPVQQAPPANGTGFGGPGAPPPHGESYPAPVENYPAPVERYPGAVESYPAPVENYPISGPPGTYAPMTAQGPTFSAPVQPGAPVESAPPTVVPDGGGFPVGPQGGTPIPEYAPVLPPSQSPGQPLSTDPFLGGGSVVSPLMGHAEPPGTLPVSYSLTGLHPYRFGFSHRLDFGLMPEQNTKRGPGFSQLGNMGFFEFDYEDEYSTPVFDRAVFSHTFQYGLRTWDGPQNAGPPGSAFINSIDLPGNVHRFGSDYELTSPVELPVVFQAGFNPSINTDFEENLTSKAWNLDARAVMFHRVSPRTTLVGGVLYWDRVDDVLLPYIGVIRKPTPRREYVLVFPHPRISFMVGDGGGIAKWLYVRGEYHVEAYQIERQPLLGSPTGPFSDQIEIRDWRVLAGFRTENPHGVSAFIEAGAIFGREVEFLNGTTDFDIDSGIIARAGLHF